MGAKALRAAARRRGERSASSQLVERLHLRSGGRPCSSRARATRRRCPGAGPSPRCRRRSRPRPTRSAPRIGAAPARCACARRCPTPSRRCAAVPTASRTNMPRAWQPADWLPRAARAIRIRRPASGREMRIAGARSGRRRDADGRGRNHRRAYVRLRAAGRRLATAAGHEQRVTLSASQTPSSEPIASAKCSSLRRSASSASCAPEISTVAPAMRTGSPWGSRKHCARVRIQRTSSLPGTRMRNSWSIRGVSPAQVVVDLGQALPVVGMHRQPRKYRWRPRRVRGRQARTAGQASETNSASVSVSHSQWPPVGPVIASA